MYRLMAVQLESGNLICTEFWLVGETGDIIGFLKKWCGAN